MSGRLGAKAYLALGLVGLFTVSTVVVVFLVRVEMRRLALAEAEHAALMLLDQQLGVHTYFTRDLKPILFPRLNASDSKDYFEPVWMSSTYAIRKIQGYANQFSHAPYGYKECAVNARSPENEADDYERAFLADLQNDPGVTAKSLVRVLEGKPYFTVLRRGETMEESCIRCHASLDQAPGDLVQRYGPERGFGRKAGEAAQAVSIRIPLSEAYSHATEFSYELAGLLLAALGGGLVFVWAGGNRLLTNPIGEIRDHAERILSNRGRLGETAPEPKVRELADLASAFNRMSVDLRRSYDEQEQRIAERTAELKEANEQLRLEVAERKNAEDALRESEERFRRFMEHLPGVAFVKDASGRHVFANRRFEEALNLDREAWYGKTNEEIFPPDVAASLTAADQTVLADRIVLRLEEQTGENTWLSFKFPIESESGGALLGGIAVDITDRKKMEEALRASEEKYRNLYDSMIDGFARVDMSGRITEYNSSFKHMVGYSDEELRELTYEDLTPEKWRALERGLLEEQVLAKGYSDVYEKEYQRKDGVVFPVELRTFLLRDGNGDASGMWAIIRDITDRKKSEELIRQADRFRAVADLSAGVAHNFNNLLQIIIGNAGLALLNLQAGDFTELKENLEQIVGSSKSGAETVRRLNRYARQARESKEMETEIFDLSDLVTQAAELTRPWWQTEPERRGVRISLNAKPRRGCTVRGRKDELFEVLVNLIRNAVDALPAGGDIEIDDSVNNDAVILRVADNGIGILKADMSRLFTPFFTTGLEPGRGLGLASCQRVIDFHGGDILVESVEEKGTCFTITLPYAPLDAAADEASEERVVPVKPLKILAVDDLAATVKLLRAGLEKFGHSVVGALSGQEALGALRENRFDLVICDLGMPEMNGWQIGKAVIQISSEMGIPKPLFVILTGWGDQAQDQGKISESGVDAVIHKPVDMAELLQAISGASQQACGQ
jgi:PAS domain S-box-containing protein